MCTGCGFGENQVGWHKSLLVGPYGYYIKSVVVLRVSGLHWPWTGPSSLRSRAFGLTMLPSYHPAALTSSSILRYYSIVSLFGPFSRLVNSSSPFVRPFRQWCCCPAEEYLHRQVRIGSHRSWTDIEIWTPFSGLRYFKVCCMGRYARRAP
jgi:hypothetical protein